MSGQICGDVLSRFGGGGESGAHPRVNQIRCVFGGEIEGKKPRAQRAKRVVAMGG